MRVLVTGGAGFIGSHLVRKCLDAGEEVRVLDDFSTGKRAKLAGLHRDVELVEASLMDRHALERAAHGCEFIGRCVRVSLLELLENIALALGVPRPELRFEPARAGDVRHSEADVSRAKVLLGWEPSTSLEAGLRETVRGYVEAAA